MVVSASADHGLFVWSLPDEESDDEVVFQPLVVLRGHEGAVNSIRFNRNNDMLASVGGENIIRLWTAVNQQTS